MGKLNLPLLLDRQARQNADGQSTLSSAAVPDSLAQAIQQVESELDAALGSLDGLGGRNTLRRRAPIARTAGRMAITSRPHSPARRVAPASRQAGADPLASEASGMSASATDRRLRSDHARTENMRRLQELWGRLLDDLLGTLAWVRELVTMIHLAKFSGAPASRADELVSQIAAAVEGL